MMKLLLMMIITINTIMIFNLHPLMITIMIIIQTMLMTSMINNISYSFWFSYMMILIMLGGMLVLFIYITTLAPNEMMNVSKMSIIIIILSTFMLIMWMIMNPDMINLPSKYDTYTLMYSDINMESQKNMNQIYNFPNEMLTMITIIYLLITMIVVATITKNQKGPLRQMN